MRLLCIVFLWIALSASQALATVIINETFESFADGDGCTQLVAGNITQCRGTGATGANYSLTTVENAIPGSAAAFPSGSKVLRVYVDSVDAEADAGIKVGALSANYLPADMWVQFAMWPNTGGGETTNVGVARPMKLFYPCNGDYPCGGGGSSGYTIIETARSTSGAPFYDTSLASTTDGSMWLYFSDHTAGTISWAGIAPPDDHKLGQTSLAEWIKPNRWNIIRCHLDFTNTASGKIDCWIGEKGSALTLVASWHGGTTVEGYAFTWTLPSATGHTQAWMPSTQPANNTFPTRHYFYYDDYYIATSEADLPNYTSVGSRLSNAVRLSGGARMQ